MSSTSQPSHPTFIEIPAPPSGAATPSDMGPSTPNSTTTSLSALSTVAMKDGHRGTNPSLIAQARRGHTSGSSDGNLNTVDALRADRISRLAGLERVGVAGNTRQGGATSAYQSPQGAGQSSTGQFASPGSPTPSGVAAAANQGLMGFTHFEPWQAAQTQKERSTVGSASATGSTGERTTTWMSASANSDSGSDGETSGTIDQDFNENENENENENHSVSMSMDVAMTNGYINDDIASQAATWDENENEDAGEMDDGQASLVGFGEGANSTVSGPISNLTRAPTSSSGSALANSSATMAPGRSSFNQRPTSSTLPMHPAPHSASASQSNISVEGALSPTGHTAAAPGAIPPSPLSSASNLHSTATGKGE